MRINSISNIQKRHHQKVLLSDYLIQMLLLQYKAKGRRTAVEYLSRNYLSGKASRDATCRKLEFLHQTSALSEVSKNQKSSESISCLRHKVIQEHGCGYLQGCRKQSFLVTVPGFTGSHEKLARKACYRLITAFVFTDNMKYHYEKKCSSFSFVFSKTQGKLFHNRKTP